MFVEVFETAKTVVARVTEAKILMMYYYTMLICCTLGEIVGEAPGVYVIRIFELVPRLPKPPKPIADEDDEDRETGSRRASFALQIFSPLTKRDLGVAAFTNEVQEFGSGQSSALPATDPALQIPEMVTARPRTSSVGRSLLDE